MRKYGNRGRLLLVVAASVLASGSSIAIAGTAEDPVRLYTNADLDRLGPPPAAPSRPIPQANLGWDYVQEFIDGEYARLYANRVPAGMAPAGDPVEGLYGRRTYASPFLGVFGLHDPWHHLSRFDSSRRAPGKRSEIRHALKRSLRHSGSRRR